MPTPDSKTVINALHDAAAFAEAVGLKKYATAFEQFYKRFQTEKPTFKVLRSLVEPLRNDFAIRISDMLCNDLGNPQEGKEALVKQYECVSVALLDMIYPLKPQMQEIDISNFAGSDYVKEKKVSFKGEQSGFREIVESSIEIVRQYSQVLGSGNFEAAYALTDSGLRAWMSFKRFVGDHERAAKQYHGPALEFHIDRFNYIYTDNAARKKSSTSVEGWPKGTPKENRRGAVGGFWIRDRAAQTGCGGTFLIAEEGGQYRIAKFTFWRP